MTINADGGRSCSPSSSPFAQRARNTHGTKLSGTDPERHPEGIRGARKPTPSPRKPSIAKSITDIFGVLHRPRPPVGTRISNLRLPQSARRARPRSRRVAFNVGRRPGVLRAAKGRRARPFPAIAPRLSFFFKRPQRVSRGGGESSVPPGRSGPASSPSASASPTREGRRFPVPHPDGGSTLTAQAARRQRHPGRNPGARGGPRRDAVAFHTNGRDEALALPDRGVRRFSPLRTPAGHRARDGGGSRGWRTPSAGLGRSKAPHDADRRGSLRPHPGASNEMGGALAAIEFRFSTSGRSRDAAYRAQPRHRGEGTRSSSGSTSSRSRPKRTIPTPLDRPRRGSRNRWNGLPHFAPRRDAGAVTASEGLFGGGPRPRGAESDAGRSSRRWTELVTLGEIVESLRNRLRRLPRIIRLVNARTGPRP